MDAEHNLTDLMTYDLRNLKLDLQPERPEGGAVRGLHRVPNRLSLNLRKTEAGRHMLELSGYGVGRGIVVAPILKMPDPLPEPADVPFVGDHELEATRAKDAITQVVQQLEAKVATADGDSAEILATTAAIAGDPALAREAIARIRAGSSAERAVFSTLKEYAENLRTMGGYMADRAADLEDVSQRIRAALAGVPAPQVPESPLPFILVARDLSPADTATLDYNTVKGLVTAEGGPTGHTAILARSRGIPALIGVEDAMDIVEHTVVILDAQSGRLLVDPDPESVQKAQALQKETKAGPEIAGPATLASGEPVQLLANIGSVADAQFAAKMQVEGVGLFRTEFVFLSSATAPTLQEQTDIYAQVFHQFPGKKVVVRTLDAGADKPLPYMNTGVEPNPALGVRGYRATEAQSEIGLTQLEAIAAAANNSEAEVWVMAPMIADATEARAFVDAAKGAGLPVAGVMAEVPSLSILADQVMAVSDFVSIGTNDLTQYALAADRLLTAVARYQDPWHPAVLRLVQELGRAATAAGKPLGVCGEAAADPLLAPVLLGLGATSLSMAIAAIPDVKAQLSTVTLEACVAAATAAVGALGPRQAREAATQILESAAIDG